MISFVYWGKMLLTYFFFCREFDEIMKALKWPFTSLSTAPPLSTTSDDYSRLENAFILLLKLQQLYLFNLCVMTNSRPTLQALISGSERYK